MATTKVAIHIQSNDFPDNQTIFLKESLIKKWKVPTDQLITLQLGSLKKKIKVMSVGQSPSFRINAGIANQLSLSHGLHLCITYHPETSTLRIGPVIAVLLSRVDSHSPDRPFGSNTAFCKELTMACKKIGGLVYFITPSDLPIRAHRIDGWCYNGNWKKTSFPVADSVYNRLTTRKLENNPKVQHFIKEVKSSYHSTVFNEKYLNKTEVFQALNRIPEVRNYLPESHSIRNYQTLKSMCSKYNIIFLKPTTGSLGKGILRISRTPSGYQCHYNQSMGMRKRLFPSLTKLYSSISAKIKKNQYQIQQGVHLIHSGGRPIDFRALVQKNRKGVWSLTSIVARIAGNDNFVSNLARGGSLTSVKSALERSSLPSEKRRGITLKLHKSALAIALGLDDQMSEHFGELGIDLAVDQSGKVWLLEVNSKPSKEEGASLGQVKIRPSVRRTILYSQHLAKF